MSVPKSRRGESPAEYINLAREIYVFTYNRVRILPKSYTFYFSLPLYNAAREAYRMIKTANLIYVDEKSPEEIRRRNIQRRKEYYETAQGYYNSMLDGLYHYYGKHEGASDFDPEKWAGAENLYWKNLIRTMNTQELEEFYKKRLGELPKMEG